MPNVRRRRFSVKDGIVGKGLEKGKLQDNVTPFSSVETNSRIKLLSENNVVKSNKPKQTNTPNNSKISPSLPVSGSRPVSTIKRTSNVMEKGVAASSSNIDLESFTLLSNTSTSKLKGAEVSRDIENKRDPRNRETISRREKYQRQHRIKVRSPKRKPIMSERPIVVELESCGTNTIYWDQEIEVLDRVTNAIEGGEEERVSCHSNEDMCRICHGGEGVTELGPLISACSCRGTVGRVHVKCLERWLTESGKSRCELCGTRYVTRRVHRYGVPRALVMWLLSHNAKQDTMAAPPVGDSVAATELVAQTSGEQLMVDTLGIMLMSPLAILAAWLSGRTLAGLMSQESQVTPWPLASTFVLACMTLVCYYCWIVSAATRHALGWWVWYRSQYEVRLQYQNTTDD